MKPDGGLPEGPHFVYDDAPGLFLGRSGRGPLEVVWDTSVLIDYLDFGEALWDGVPLDVAAEYRDQLEALNNILQLWVLRDIRFHVLDRTLTDAKRVLSRERRSARGRAIEHLTAALQLDAWEGISPRPQRSPPINPDQFPIFGTGTPFSRIPAGPDRDLVEGAVGMGVHVFLVRDDRVEKRAADFKPWGLLIASPLRLVDELAACGALLALVDPDTAHWPVPDLQRMSHLIQALG